MINTELEFTDFFVKFVTLCGYILQAYMYVNVMTGIDP